MVPNAKAQERFGVSEFWRQNLAGFSRFSVRVVSFVLSRIGLIRMHESRTKKAMRSSLRE